MADALAPRGPDGSGAWAHGGIALGHRRLRIIDLSERGAQPMVDSELGLAVVFNGCIYNHRELRRELEAAGLRFFSDSDTEVVLKAYRLWGERCVDRFKGMFAFAIAERDSGRLVLARDRLGVKPLYLADGPAGAALRLDPPRAAARRRRRHHDRSRGAASLPQLALGRAGAAHDPGRRAQAAARHRAHRRAGRPAPRTVYWDPPFARDPARADWTPEDWQDAMLEALRVAVDRRMVADVPVGVLLSGGLDSSLIVALLAQAGQRGLKTFSVGFPAAGGREGDEFAYSDLVAERFDTDHRQIRVDDDRLLPALHEAVGAMSEPMVSHDCVAFHLLSEEVSRHVKVVQCGQGADEILAGYSWYQPLPEADGDGLDGLRAGVLRPPPRRLVALLGDGGRLDEDASRRFAAEHFARPGADGPVDRALRLDSEVMLVDDPVKRVDNMTMASAWRRARRSSTTISSSSRPRARRRSSSPTTARACSRTPRGACCRPRSSTAPRATSPCPRSATSRVPTSSSCARRCTPRRRASARCSTRRGSPACSPSPTSTSRRCRATACGSSACSSCGCRSRASDDAEALLLSGLADQRP